MSQRYDDPEAFLRLIRGERLELDEELNPPTPRIYSVSELAEEINLQLLDTFPEVRVRGEVSEANHWRRPGSEDDWMFLVIKDERAQLNAVITPEVFHRLHTQGTLPVKGKAYIFTGSVGFYQKRGELRLEIRDIHPEGIGLLYEQYILLKEKLAREGYFDEARKRPLPVLIRSLGIVTSIDGAAIRDILKTLHTGGLGLRIECIPAEKSRALASLMPTVAEGTSYLNVVIHHSAVQGAKAPADLITGLMHLNRRPDIDAIIIGRGGGSLEDLWAFNDEHLIQAIAASDKPVISAVGHEKDETLSDLVADLRASTPTRAAEIIAQHRRRLIDHLQQLGERIDRAVDQAIRDLYDAVWSQRNLQAFYRVDLRLREFEQRVADQHYRLENQTRAMLHQQERRLQSVLNKLQPGILLSRTTDALRHLHRLHRSLDTQAQSHHHRLQAYVTTWLGRLEMAASREMNRVQQQVSMLRTRLRPDGLQRSWRQNVEKLEILMRSLEQNWFRHWDQIRSRLQQLAHRLHQASPLTVLKRGYSITLDPAGTVVESFRKLQTGTPVRVLLGEGMFESHVERIQPQNLLEQDQEE